MGPRHLVGAAADRREHRRPAAQAGGAADQAGLALRVRPHHRRADLADRRAAGAADRRAGREDLADAAVRDQAAAVLADLRRRERPDRLHAGSSRAQALENLKKLPLGAVAVRSAASVRTSTARSARSTSATPTAASTGRARRSIPRRRSSTRRPSNYQVTIGKSDGSRRSKRCVPTGTTRQDPRSRAGKPSRIRSSRHDAARRRDASGRSAGSRSRRAVREARLQAAAQFPGWARTPGDGGRPGWPADREAAVRRHRGDRCEQQRRAALRRCRTATRRTTCAITRLLKGMNIPKTGQGGSVGIMVTKTVVVAGDPQITAPPGRRARRDAARV